MYANCSILPKKYDIKYHNSDSLCNLQIVDRPLQHELHEGRKYVQPQWVYDCVNAKKILPTQDYLAGR